MLDKVCLQKLCHHESRNLASKHITHASNCFLLTKDLLDLSHFPTPSLRDNIMGLKRVRNVSIRECSYSRKHLAPIGAREPTKAKGHQGTKSNVETLLNGLSVIYCDVRVGECWASGASAFGRDLCLFDYFCMPLLTVDDSADWLPARNGDATWLYMTSYAPSGRAKCRKCSNFIEKGKVRFGIPIKVWKEGEWVSAAIIVRGV